VDILSQAEPISLGTDSALRRIALSFHMSHEGHEKRSASIGLSCHYEYSQGHGNVINR